MEYRAISRVQVLTPVAQMVLFACVFTAAGQTICLPPPSGLVSWWQGETNALDAVGANDGTLQDGASFGPGMVGQAFNFSGANQFVYVPDAPSLDPQDAMTLEGWIYAADIPAGDSMVVVAKDDAGSSRQYQLAVVTGQNGLVFRPHVGLPDGFMYFDGTTPIQTNTWYHAAMTYDGSQLSLYVNGNLDGSMAVSGQIITTTVPLTIGGLAFGPWFFRGRVDELSLYNRALAADEIQAIYNTGITGKCSPPILLSEPVDQTVISGDTVSFGVVARGASPLIYQWSHDGTSILDATDASLTLYNVQASQGGGYAVAVTNAFGATNSTSALLTVNPAPPCTNPPPDLISWWSGEGNALDRVGSNNGTLVNGAAFTSGMVGQAFTFNGLNQSVDVPNAPSLNPTAAITLEAWVYPTANPSGASMAIVSKDNASSARQYLLVLAKDNQNQLVARPHIGVPGGFANFNGTNAIQLNTWNHIAMTYDGAFLSLYVNGDLDGSLAVSGPIITTTQPLRIGGAAPSYYFNGYIDEVSLYGRALTPSEIHAIYDIGSLGKCLVPIPAFIVVQPANLTATLGSNATSTVAAGGSVPFGYQWSFKGTRINGATSSSLTLTNVQFSQTGNYAVIVTNAAGRIPSSNALLTVVYPPAVLRVVGSTNAAAGGNVTLPMTLAANGNESALSFSLNFDPTRLTYTGATLGSGASGAGLLVNMSQIAGGRLGVSLGLPAATTFSPGTQQVAQISFAAAASTNTVPTGITFGDLPTARQLLDMQLNPLAAWYSNATVIIVGATAFEGDVFPLPTPDKSVGIADWLQMGRYAARLDYPTNGAEFQRADCAPRSTLGDGAITVADWVQVGRYASGLDALTAASGPTNEIAYAGAGPSASRLLSVGSATFAPGQTNTVPIVLAAQGNENALGFSLAFDRTVAAFVSASLGSGAAGATLYVNTNQLYAGWLGLAAALNPGSSFAPGGTEMIKVSFRAVSSVTASSALAFTDQPVPREIADVTALALPASYVNSTLAVNLLPSLSIARSGTNVTLSWPLWAANFNLQEAAGALRPANSWTNLPATVVVSNGQSVVTLPISRTNTFYRLYHP